ncbi:hypothetical protein MHH52_25645 [Paenibacillus sp. FSL K6-0276]|uniref:DUF6979 family protein n=1 Tax=Paenibacillus sp. FSL K6-0276 TaxID=2921450 RepID=UPI0030EE8955
MSKYGEAAVKTVQYLKENQLESPKTAWEVITKEFFWEGTASQKNKAYGLKALELIRKNPDLIEDKKTLWLETIGHEKKAPNS